MNNTLKIVTNVNGGQYLIDLQELVNEIISNTNLLPIIQTAVDLELKKRDALKKYSKKKIKNNNP